MKIGFIGLGIMGKPMACNLMKKGHELVVFDIVERAMKELVEAGAESAASPKLVAQKTKLIITMLPNSPHVKEAILGKDGVIEGINQGSALIDMSSIAPSASREVARALEAKGVEVLDAPVSGGEPKAIDGSLAIMVGGKSAVFEKFREILLCMGSSAVLCGEAGAGNVTKLANQIIVAVNIAAMSEAFTLAAKAGVEPEDVFNAIKGGLAGSTVLNAKAPMVLAGNYKPGFRVELHIKDLQNALATAKEIGAPSPLTEKAMEMLLSLKADGKESLDHSGIIQYYEKLAGIKVRAKSGSPS